MKKRHGPAKLVVMATMIPNDIEEFVTEGEKAFYPGSGKQRPLAGVSPRLGVRPTRKGTLVQIQLGNRSQRG
jgi:hypothetical protein